MNLLVTILVTIWLLLGCIAVWRTYFGIIKEWSMSYNVDYWEVDSKHMTIKILFILSIFYISFGLLTLIAFEKEFQYNCWYYKHRKYGEI